MTSCQCEAPQWGGIVMPKTKKEIEEILAKYTELQIKEDPILSYLQVELGERQ